MQNTPKIIQLLYYYIVQVISETNGLSLKDTLELLTNNPDVKADTKVLTEIQDFIKILELFEINKGNISNLLKHPVSEALFLFFKNFPLTYREEHIHLTGSLSPEFIYPRLKKLLNGPNKDLYLEKIKLVYGPDVSIKSISDVEKLVRLKPEDAFDRYLQILLLPKLILIDRKSHEEASYHLAHELFHRYNVGSIRLKFTLSRSTSNESEQIPGIESITPEDVVLGLYNGFKKFKKEQPNFKFILSPCFRKEADFFDSKKYKSKQEDFNNQVLCILDLIHKYPELARHLQEVDTVGNERNLYRKQHFNEMKNGLRKLQIRGFGIRSHHGETWKTLKKGVQAVDNAMNIWRVDAIEHGISLGINPNYYYHSIFQKICAKNKQGKALDKTSMEYAELLDMDWTSYPEILKKLVEGTKLDSDELILFTKTKFHTASEVEYYQHDILNRLIDKEVSLIALPSSNKKLTGQFEDYKDHPFSWWEKKNIKLGVGTDNYITLNTNYIREMLILLYTDPSYLKITKLLIITTGEDRRPFISQLLWSLRKQTPHPDLLEDPAEAAD